MSRGLNSDFERQSALVIDNNYALLQWSDNLDLSYHILGFRERDGLCGYDGASKKGRRVRQDSSR